MQEQKQNSTNQNIFKSISNLIISNYFRSAQTQYFDKNCHLFESENENKHEYYALFKEYQQLINISIESQLLQEFSDKEITSFFNTFLQDLHLYKNQETIDTLKMFTDFEVFKNIMVDYNQRLNKGKKENDCEIKLEITNNVLDEYYKKPNSEWSYLLQGKKNNDITILACPFKDTGLKILKTEFEIENIEMEAIKELIINPDMEKVKKNLKIIEEAKIVEVVNENQKVMYFVFNLPMMQRREMLISSVYYKQGQQHILVQNSVDHPNQPVNPKFIRAVSHKSYHISQIEGTNRTKIVIFEFNDMKGFIPKMFLNLMITKTAKKSVEGFIQQCQDKQKEIDQQKLK